MYTERYKEKLRCRLCPHGCIITEGKSGLCMVRYNKGGELSLPYYGALSAVSSDPIEKKPLYHFHPGSTIFSVGFYGCSFSCPFCQNYRIALSLPKSADSPVIEPKDLLRMAEQEGARSIAYTYSEPLVHYEWVLETARIASSRGFSNVLVSNGYINPEPADELLPYIDAANIDLKSFRNAYYTKVIGGKLQPVLDFIEKASMQSHIEVTTLVIPDETDSDEEIGEIASFLAGLNPNIPYHLSCYYPTYRYTKPPTSAETVFNLVEKAKEKLNYVYPGNVGLSEVDTECTECGNTLIRRRGYGVDLSGIRSIDKSSADAGRGGGESEAARAVCTGCGAEVPFPV